MNRKPTPKSQAELLIAEMARLGFSLQRGAALDLVAKLEGYRGWNEFLAATVKVDPRLSEFSRAHARWATQPQVPAPAAPLAYSVEIPSALYEGKGTVTDTKLAEFLQHGKDSVTCLLEGVTLTGERKPAEAPFRDLAIHESFFDPYCGESFRKTGDSTALMISGDADGVMPGDSFKPGDKVLRELYDLKLCGYSRYEAVGASTTESTDRAADQDQQELVNNPWFEWTTDSGEIIGRSFSKLPRDPREAINKHLAVARQG